MSARYVTVTFNAEVLEVHSMLDKFTQPTDDPALAVWVMVKLDAETEVEEHVSNVPIYTVH